jgi:hypothetical protein
VRMKTDVCECVCMVKEKRRRTTTKNEIVRETTLVFNSIFVFFFCFI